MMHPPGQVSPHEQSVACRPRTGARVPTDPIHRSSDDRRQSRGGSLGERVDRETAPRTNQIRANRIRRVNYLSCWCCEAFIRPDCFSEDFSIDGICRWHVLRATLGSVRLLFHLEIFFFFVTSLSDFFLRSSRFFRFLYEFFWWFVRKINVYFVIFVMYCVGKVFDVKS